MHDNLLEIIIKDSSVTLADKIRITSYLHKFHGNSIKSAIKAISAGIQDPILTWNLQQWPLISIRLESGQSAEFIQTRQKYYMDRQYLSP